MNEIEKILIVTTEFPPGPGGIGNHAHSLTKSLAKRGYNVFVVTNADYAGEEEINLFDSSQDENIFIKRVLRSGIKMYFQRFMSVVEIIKSENVKTVLLSGKFSLWVGGLLKLLGYKVKTIAVLHGFEVKLGNKFFKRVTDYSISKADFLMPVSQFTYSLLTKELQQKPYRIVENGIDLQEMKGLDVNEKNTIELKGSPALLTVGNVTPRKGQHRVIKAMPEIVKRFPDVHYHIVGLPTHKDEFYMLAKSLGVQKNITFHGRLPERSDLATVYKKADCFVILSENQPSGDVEGFGIVILEANYFGLPAVVAKGCGIEDAISNGYNGYLVDGDDAVAISHKIEMIIDNRHKLSENSVKWAESHSWDTIVDKYIEEISSY